MKFCSKCGFILGTRLGLLEKEGVGGVCVNSEKKKEIVKWKNLAKSVDTIVIMMGLSRIDVICKQLIAGGLDKKTPVAVIQNGTTPQQKMIKGTVTNIAKKVKENKITPPTNIIIGKVVDLSDTIGWK